MKYSIENIKQLMPNSEILYFWGHTPNPKKITKACLSQWFDCVFEVDNIQYHTAEQYMMAQKALLFNDTSVYEEIMSSNNPRDYKSLGRKIKDFNAALWDTKKYDIVVKGNISKFSQNPDLKEFLLSTKNSILVEASPYDTIWGIGLSKEEAEKCSINQWKGSNLLGFALMETRDAISKESKFK